MLITKTNTFIIGPVATLLGFIMTYCGYGGAIVFFIIAFCYFRQKKKDKLEGIEA